MTEIPGDHLTIYVQSMRFLGSFLLGLPIGLLLDCFRTLRAVLPHHAIAVFLEDTLFAFLSCFLLQCYVWMYADGMLRWQYAAGALLGFLLYLLTVGAVWMRILKRLRRFCCALWQKIGRVFVGNSENLQSEKNVSESP